MKKFFFIDMEMTGLDVNENRIIEVAVIITDLKLNELDRYQAVIQQPKSFLDAMDDWNVSTHTASGLINEVPRGRLQIEVEMDLINFVKKHFNGQRVMLAGNSISQDKLFIETYMKRFAKFLHYRIIDISSMKAIYQSLYNVRYQKGVTHRAMDDIGHSIAELKLYISFLDLDKIDKFVASEANAPGQNAENSFFNQD